MTGTMKPKKPALKAVPSKVDWQGHWTQLFDPAERQAAVNAINQAFYWLADDQATGRRGRHEPQVFSISLYTITCKPLIEYLGELEKRSPGAMMEGQTEAVELLRVLDDICETITAGKLLPARIDGLMNTLAKKWDAFAIAGAAFRMYLDVPIELERKKRQGDGGKRGAAERTKVSANDLAVKERALIIAGTSKRDLTARLARHFNVSVDAIRKARKKVILK